MLLIALVLMLCREANVVLPADVTSAAVERALTERIDPTPGDAISGRTTFITCHSLPANMLFLQDMPSQVGARPDSVEGGFVERRVASCVAHRCGSRAAADHEFMTVESDRRGTALAVTRHAAGELRAARDAGHGAPPGRA